MKHKLKLILASILQYGCALFLGWYFNHLIEVIIIIPLFFYFRSKYTKTFHARTMWECTLFTISMFFIIVLLAQPIAISIFLTIILCYVTTEVLYFVKDYLDLLQVKRFKIYIGMNKQVLEQKCLMYNLTDIETKVLVYFYCDKLKRWQIGNILSYSEDNISKIKAKALEKFKKEPSQAD